MDSYNPCHPKSQHPSIDQTAFACPHCGAYARQFWSQTQAAPFTDEPKHPSLPSPEMRKAIAGEPDLSQARKKEILDWLALMESGLPFSERLKSGRLSHSQIHNLFLSECFNCHKLAVWVHDRLVFPAMKTGPQPNGDLPEGILRDYEEARTILDFSPRGAAALLRLAIQKMCDHLEPKGVDINAQIADLVTRGLDPMVQQALDVVRVIGNEAVHPGTIDLRDDRDTASKLFDLVNVVADEMISRPKKVQALYEKLPPEKRAAISTRDAKAGPKNQ